jgi:hypothetical protein
MSPVVDKNVQLLWEIQHELLPKGRVPLITNHNADTFLLKLLAFGVDVYSYVTRIS